jgi:hypothetical protein
MIDQESLERPLDTPRFDAHVSSGALKSQLAMPRLRLEFFCDRHTLVAWPSDSTGTGQSLIGETST